MINSLNCDEERRGENMDQILDVKLTSKQREYLDTKLALALLEQLFFEGKINEKTIENIRKNTKRRLDGCKQV